MLCEKCGSKNATTHIRTVVNGHVYEKHLCAACASEDGYNTVQGKNITQMLTSMFGETPKNNAARCSCCGSSFNDIASSGKCGCAQCYSTFYEQLLPYFKRAQYGGTAHKGKVLNIREDFLKSTTEKIDELRLTLKQLIIEEKYEQAAVIRDQIKQLEEEML